MHSVGGSQPLDCCRETTIGAVGFELSVSHLRFTQSDPCRGLLLNLSRCSLDPPVKLIGKDFE